MKLNLDDHFRNQLPADPDESNGPRQVHEAAFSYVTPRVPTKPQLLHASAEVAKLIGVSDSDLAGEDFVNVFSGGKVLEGARPFSMCYGGHQFGNWAGQLGDGRAINLCEVQHLGRKWMLQLKGAGETPYSRTADGLAVLRSSLREHLCSEAMFHLGVPTTRSLSLITTGDQVMRDVMYDGNPAYETGAVVCRVAKSFIRFGSFQIFASRGDISNLKTLTDYTIESYFPNIDPTKQGYVSFFREIAMSTLEMVIHWQRVGFVHGVMNTDNMSIHSDTIDYGPYGWLEGYDHNWTPNTTDRQHRRYRYGQQPQIALWNLAQLANALVLLVKEVEPFEEVVEEYKQAFQVQYNEMIGKKIGLSQVTEDDENFLRTLEAILHLTETDMTIFFRRLASFEKNTSIDEEGNFLDTVKDAFYSPDELNGDVLSQWTLWFREYQKRLRNSSTSDADRAELMNGVNPKYVLRNYMAQLAIDAAEQGDNSIINELFEMLKSPYSEQPENEKWFAKRPDWARHKVGCSMLSCSS